MKQAETKPKLWRRIVYFFPLQLLLLHFKKNFLVLLYWFFLFGIVLESIGVKYGLPNLLLFPEYLNRVDLLSHFILGISVGGFVMAFNIAGYIVNGASFSFIATLAKPFTKFVLNNFIIPIAFFGVHIYKIIDYQLTKELIASSDILLNVAGYLGGLTVVITLSMTYFLNTNTSVKFLFGKENEQRIRKNFMRQLFYKNLEWYGRSYQLKDSHVETYIASLNKIGLARSGRHYDTKMLEKVFAQNHINASFFEILVIASIFIIGSLREFAFFNVPAGASLFLLFTLFLMLSSALYSWIREWSGLVALSAFLLLNYLSTTDKLSYRNYAYGLDYSTQVTYDNEKLQQLTLSSENYINDSLHTVEILNRWRDKNLAITGEKPHLILVNTSGGGLRSAYWSFKNLAYLDSITNQQFSNQSFMISGSSGGMIGAAFYRELLRQKLTGDVDQIPTKSQESKLTKDILNPIMMAVATNDLFLRAPEFEYNGKTYRKDRAYAFEKQLNTNTDSVFDRPMGFYKDYETNAQLPWMVFSPSVNNDGRRLLISNQKISYLCYKHENGANTPTPIVEAVEYTRLFEGNHPHDTRFSSVLRMSATFPYILPNVYLPTTPPIEVMDAGVRDNYGILNSLKFVEVFERWISENTKGVILIQLNDIQDDVRIKSNPKNSILQNVLKPAQGFTENWLVVQKFNADALFQSLDKNFEHPLDYYKIELQQKLEEKISLSWHLTKIEKQRIRKGLTHQKNQFIYQQIEDKIGKSNYLASSK